MLDAADLPNRGAGCPMMCHFSHNNFTIFNLYHFGSKRNITRSSAKKWRFLGKFVSAIGEEDLSLVARLSTLLTAFPQAAQAHAVAMHAGLWDLGSWAIEFFPETDASWWLRNSWPSQLDK